MGVAVSGRNLYPDGCGGWWPVALVMAVAFYLIQVYLERSRVGYQLAGVREDEDAAAVFGYDTPYFKLTVFAVSACMASVAGSAPQERLPGMP